MHPQTVDDLFTLPEDGYRYQVIGGCLLKSPASSPPHQVVSNELQRLLDLLARPHGARAISAVAVRITDHDGPLPDISVVSASGLRGLTGAVPLSSTYTVVEIVSPSSALLDRSAKPDLYAEAGIPCYWRVEIKRSRRHNGPFPLAVGPDTWIDVTLDPADLDTL